MFENHRKSLIQHCERSELRFHFNKNAKNSQFSEFLKTRSLRSNSVTRQVNFNKTKICGKCQRSNATSLLIFKHCAKPWSLQNYQFLSSLVTLCDRKLKVFKNSPNWLFLAFLLKCKRCSLRSQYWMRLFLWFSNNVK